MTLSRKQVLARNASYDDETPETKPVDETPQTHLTIDRAIVSQKAALIKQHKASSKLPDIMTRHLVGEDEASAPRKRLAELLGYGSTAKKIQYDAADREIGQLAKQHPEVFARSFHFRHESDDWEGERPGRQSPLSLLVNFQDGQKLVSIDTFEAAYKAFPDAIHDKDSYGDTLMEDLLNKHWNSEDWFALLCFLVEKSSALLVAQPTESQRGHYVTPIMKAVYGGCPQRIIQFMIDKHPGDPFREKTRQGRTLLQSVLGGNSLPLDFVKYVYHKNPDAAKLQETEYKSTVLHVACRYFRSNPDLFNLLLTDHPELAFLRAMDSALPLHELIGDIPWIAKTQEDQKVLALVAQANPNAIFANKYYRKDRCPSSPFFMLSNFVVGHGKKSVNLWPIKKRSDENIWVGWSCLYFLMNVYRYGNKTNIEQAWQPPQHPVHMAASCPCPSNFLLHLARSHPDHLMQVDTQGRTVLALALESGHSVVKRRKGDWYGDDANSHCIQKLVEIDIRAVGMPDPKTGFYPFMIAASMENQIVDMGILDDHVISLDCGSPLAERHAKKNQDQAPLICLNTIYYLLRIDPSKACPIQYVP